MDTFIKVIEIWTPDSARKQLSLADSYYGEHSDFNKHSLDISFAYNEGLPGTAWAQSTPVIITDLEHSCFLRKEIAKKAGISCAIAVPIFAGQYLLAVLVLLCGDSDKLTAAIEVWGKDPQHSDALQLIDGYYGKLEKFEQISRRTSFEKGNGFPGAIWDYHIPQIISELSSSTAFLRASSAQLEGLTTAFGIPFFYDKTREFVLTFLSARRSPLAHRFEIWLPDREHQFLSMFSGHTEIPHDVFSYQEIRKGEGLIGQAWLTGCPAISHDPIADCFIAKQAASDNLKVSVAIPIIEDGALTSVVAFTL